MAVSGRFGVAVEPLGHGHDRFGIGPGKRPDLRQGLHQVVRRQLFARVEGQLEAAALQGLLGCWMK